MPKYVFHYFPIKALGESVRLLLAYGGEGFEDHRIDFEDWPAFKPNTPFGQMPVLEFDGKQYAQSLAIARYLGHKYGLAGETLEDNLEIDQNVYLINDLRTMGSSACYEKDEVIKEQKYKEYSAGAFPDYLQKLNNIIVKNNGYVALGKLTWADFMFAGLYDHMKGMMRMPDLGENYPALQQVKDRVYSFPKVKAYADAVAAKLNS
ncbi:glutathione S-transferase 2-like isoform X1 [Spodoptera frugiperda]|uniref:glutathione transferase n=1 Tax=Spodoptera frugiperda TaxID=7108 RepID=A0A9R0EVK1_SPOFR|nr:glutathione S-transferase 2-like isoform X1 [Spodoptera frugiperda]XP_050549800.1 glutathione S-transferase 2-like isoform X1 [Spodoptera frugiperda]